MIGAGAQADSHSAPPLNGRKRDMVPAEPIRKIVRQALLRASAPGASNRDYRFGVLANPVFAVAAEIVRKTGKSQDTEVRFLHRLLKGDPGKDPPPWVAFDKADAVLCAFDEVWQWYTNPQLREHYRRIFPDDGVVRCLHCGGKNETQQSFFCSRRCASRSCEERRKKRAERHGDRGEPGTAHVEAA